MSAVVGDSGSGGDDDRPDHGTKTALSSSPGDFAGHEGAIWTPIPPSMPSPDPDELKLVYSLAYFAKTAHMKLATLPDGVWCGSALIHRPESAVS